MNTRPQLFKTPLQFVTENIERSADMLTEQGVHFERCRIRRDNEIVDGIEMDAISVNRLIFTGCRN